MALDSRSLTDCSFFSSGSCRNGGKCLFRHMEFAEDFSECEAWKSFKCFDVSCREKHPAFPQPPNNNSKATRPKELCNFFLLGRCRNDHCRFSHELPAPLVSRQSKRPHADDSISIDNKTKTKDILLKYSTSQAAVKKKRDNKESAMGNNPVQKSDADESAKSTLNDEFVAL